MSQAIGRAAAVTVVLAGLIAGCASPAGLAGTARPAGSATRAANGHPAANGPLRTAAPAGSGTAAPGGSASAGPSGAAGSRPGTAAKSGPAGASSAGRPLAGQVVALDPGHNGANWSHPAIIDRLVNVITEWKACDTTGTQTATGYAEHAFSFDVAIRLARLLRAEGATVVLTRHNDSGVGPCITQRAAIGNQAHAAAALSIHADGGPPSGSGFEVIEPGLVAGHNDAIIAPSDRLALAIRDAYHRITGEPYSDYVGTAGLDVRTDLGGLNLSTVPKVLIECGNMTNGPDAARLSSPAFRQRIAVGLAAGLTAFLRLTRHP
jgi:N-acetylmuramoyl-L-alanine amidase